MDNNYQVSRQRNAFSEWVRKYGVKDVQPALPEPKPESRGWLKAHWRVMLDVLGFNRSGDNE